MSMKILYASQRPYYPLRVAHGGQRTTHDLLIAAQAIAQSECFAIFYTRTDYLHEYLPDPSQWNSLGIKEINTLGETTKIDCGYPIRAITTSVDAFWQHLENVYYDFAPNVVLTGQRGAFEIVCHARNKGIPVIWNIDTSPGQGVYEIAELIKAVQIGAGIICCSQYVFNRITALTSSLVKPAVVYPPMNCAAYQVANRIPKFITVVNPVPVKGGDILGDIVKEFSEEQFLLVIGWELETEDDYWPRFQERMQRYGNVRIVPRTPDIRTVFSATKILLVPSQWDEAFGRIVWEARCNGIPSIVSAVGGLPEVLGTGGELVANYWEPSSWVNTLRSVLQKTEYLGQSGARAQESARSTYFSTEASVTAFMKAINTVVENELPNSFIN